MLAFLYTAGHLLSFKKKKKAYNQGRMHSTDRKQFVAKETIWEGNKVF